MLISILLGIFFLALAGIVVIFLKRGADNADMTGIAIAVQAIATVVLVVVNVALVKVTWIYVDEVKRGRESQESTSKIYIDELQEQRKQQLRPYPSPLFYWAPDIGKFMFVLKNVGLGPARDIEYSYELVGDDGQNVPHTGKCSVLAAGDEFGDLSPFASEHMNAKNNNVIGSLRYKDIFGTQFTDHFQLNLRELTNNPPPSKHAEERRKRIREAQKY